MRKLILLFIIFIGGKALGNTPSDTLLPQILTIQLETFVGKPVDSLFSALPSGYSSRTFIPSSRIGYTRGISQNYSFPDGSNCFVQIFIDTFAHLTVPNYSAYQNWSINLAKQEMIAFIKVWSNNLCIYMCDNLRY